MKRRGYPVTGGQYTSLFNACANSLNTRKALEIAQKVRDYLSKDELHKANMKNYNSMIKGWLINEKKEISLISMTVFNSI